MASEQEKPDADLDKTSPEPETKAVADAEAGSEAVGAVLESTEAISSIGRPEMEFRLPDLSAGNTLSAEETVDDELPETDSSVSRTQFALYDLDDIRAVLGMARKTGLAKWETMEISENTDHQEHLVAILHRGETARWRHALGPTDEAERAIAALVGRAPHFVDLGSMLQTNAKAARTIGLPMFVHPVLLVGEPGMGKTWFLSKLANLLGLPFRMYSMSTSTLGEGLQGSHPSWRNAGPGLVAKTLFREKAANPLIFVDEFDKVVYGSWNSDPYRPFYTLLDPSGSHRFVDEYLGFPIDASNVLWVMAANDVSMVPAPILDRLTVLHVPPMTAEQRIVVIQSIYAEANAKHLSFFDTKLEGPALSELAMLNPRRLRITIEFAMANAAADGRREIAATDINPRKAGHSNVPLAKGDTRPRGKAARRQLN